MIDDQSLPDSTGKLTIHASAVCVDGEALIFLGPSGTGKSTVSGLLSAHAQLLADDVVRLAPHANDDRWLASNANRVDLASAPPEVYRAALDGLPLRAIFRLHQTPGTNIERANALEICRCLTDAFFEVCQQRSYNTETKKRAFRWLAAVARATPGYWLHFNLFDPIAPAVGSVLGLDLQLNSK